MIEPIVDISKWQGDINKQKFLDAGALGVIIRAGNINSGGPYTDSKFASNVQKFNGAIPCGYYWYFKPEYSASTQAVHFANLVKNVKVDLPLFADVESNAGHVSVGTFQNRLSEFLIRVTDLTDKDAGIYTRGNFWNANLGNPSWASNYKLWIARYSNSLNHPWQGGAYKPNSWNDYWLWQYSAGGNGRGPEFGTQSNDLDINRYNGTLEEFYKEANWNQEPEPPTKSKLCVFVRTIRDLCDNYLKGGCDATALEEE